MGICILSITPAQFRKLINQNCNSDKPRGQHSINCLANLDDQFASYRFSNLKLTANKFVAIWACQFLQCNQNTLMDCYWVCHLGALPLKYLV